MDSGALPIPTVPAEPYHGKARIDRSDWSYPGLGLVILSTPARRPLISAWVPHLSQPVPLELVIDPVTGIPCRLNGL